MKNIDATGGSFALLERDANAQTAVMRLPKGVASGPFGNEHAGSTQILMVVSGRVQAEVEESHFTMSPGDSAIVPKGAPHRFIGDSEEIAVTFNVYSPPAY